MRDSLNFYSSPPFPPPSPSPALTPSDLTAATAADQKMLVSVFLALFLPCAGMSAVFIIYICLLWIASNYDRNRSDSAAMKPAAKSGLSAAELEKLPKITGKELVMGNECAVCLDEIEEEDAARLVPGCNHGFHLQCADTWLSKHSVCPVCRAKLERQFFNGDENPC